MPNMRLGVSSCSGHGGHEICNRISIVHPVDNHCINRAIPAHAILKLKSEESDAENDVNYYSKPNGIKSLLVVSFISHPVSCLVARLL
jgi:hypothetical protein